MLNDSDFANNWFPLLVFYFEQFFIFQSVTMVICKTKSVMWSNDLYIPIAEFH